MNYCNKFQLISVFDVCSVVMVGSATQCSAEPVSIQNAVKSGTGLASGSTRTFACDGDYAWSDDTTGGKPVYCQPDGKWTGIPLTCLCMILSLFFWQVNLVSPYFLLLRKFPQFILIYKYLPHI